MKKFLLMAATLVMGAAMFTSCDKEEEVKEYVVDFEGEYFTNLIDNPQFKGSMLYGDGSYSWTDAAIGLTSKLTNAWDDGQFWGGGIAISNYVDADIKNHATSEYQLSVPTSNGSKNFAVAYCNASMSFADGQPHVIKNMMVSPTTYELGVITYGDGYAASLAESGRLTLVITGYNGENETAQVKVDMAKDGELLTTWKNVVLSDLGMVTSVSFSMEGTDASNYGVKAPAYFAFDNVTIEK